MKDMMEGNVTKREDGKDTRIEVGKMKTFILRYPKKPHYVKTIETIRGFHNLPQHFCGNFLREVKSSNGLVPESRM